LYILKNPPFNNPKIAIVKLQRLHGKQKNEVEKQMSKTYLTKLGTMITAHKN